MSDYNKKTSQPNIICRDIYFVETRFVAAIFDHIILKPGNTSFDKFEATNKRQFSEPVRKDKSKNEFYDQSLTFDYNANYPHELIGKQYVVKIAYSDGTVKQLGSLKQPAEIHFEKKDNISNITFSCKSYTPAKELVL